MNKKRIVIVGGGACGAKVAARARRNSADTGIVMIEKGPYVSYAGCGMPYYIAGAVKRPSELMSMLWGTVRDAKYFMDSKDVTVYTKTSVQSIDPAGKIIKIITASGEIKKIDYSNLVLATGAKAKVPAVKGMQLKNVFVLRSLEQAEAIRKAVESEGVENAVIVGAGRVGLELADAFNAQGLSITIIEMAEQVLPDVLDSDMSHYPANTIRSEKINLYLSESVVEITGDENSMVKKVITDKRELDADIVIFAVGITPDVELARSAGIQIGATGAIEVDECMQTNIPGIYAGGDCVECTDIVTGEKIHMPLGSVANKHGRIIANNITGVKDTFPGVVGSCILMSLGLKTGKTGLTEKQAKKYGYRTETCLSVTRDTSHFLAGSKNIVIKLIASVPDRRLLGAQIAGTGDIAKRLDVAATALYFKATIDDIASMDLCYAPPFSGAMDSIIHTANIMRNKLAGSVKTMPPSAVRHRLKTTEDIIVLDLRTKEEITEGKSIDDGRVMCIPLENLRAHINDLPRDKEIICTCQYGTRAYEAYTVLKNKGFQSISYMECGMFGYTWLS